jgi:hypothetical protein
MISANPADFPISMPATSASDLISEAESSDDCDGSGLIQVDLD